MYVAFKYGAFKEYGGGLIENAKLDSATQFWRTSIIYFGNKWLFNPSYSTVASNLLNF